MFNYYQQGHTNGHSDAIQGNDKNLEHGMPILSALVSEKAVSTYCDGYNAGYAKGKREILQKLEKDTLVREKTVNKKGDVDISF